MNTVIQHDLLHGQVNGQQPDLLCIDVETTMRSPGKFSADPFYPDNRCLLYGYVRKHSDSILWEGEFNSIFSPNETTKLVATTPTFLIGCNIKFDMHYMTKVNKKSLDNVYGAYDIQGIHHILTGETFKGLAYLCDYYKVKHGKQDVLKDWLAAGKNIECMPMPTLRRYLSYDVRGTRDVFEAQMAIASPAQLKLINIQARLIMALQEMESNGLQFDMNKLVALSKATCAHKDAALATIKKITCNKLALDHKFPSSALSQINFTSNRTVSMMLYNTGIPVTTNPIVGQYKNGKVKRKIAKRVYTPSGKAFATAVGKLTSLGYPVPEAELAQLLRVFEKDTTNNCQTQIEYLKAVLDYRKSKKILSTYIEPLALVMENNEEYVVHPTYNIAATPTGRLSSSSPNAQNLPPVIKDCIACSIPKGRHYEADWKQLEVCGAAMVSGDSQLMSDINKNVDIHAEIGQQAGIPPSDRRRAKGVVFGTIYGGGVNALAKTADLPQKVVRSIQKAMFARYPQLKTYYQEFNEHVKALPVTGLKYDTNGKAVPYRTYTSITGRDYIFKEKYNKWTRNDGVSWTETCNYPIQGISTGDIVPAYLALLWMWKKRTNNGHLMRLILTVHDSYGFDWNFLEEPLSNTDVGQLLYERYMEFKILWELWVGEPLTVPLTLDIEEKPRCKS